MKEENRTDPASSWSVTQHMFGVESSPDAGGHNTEDCRWVVIGNEPGETEAAGVQHDTGLNRQWTR